MNVIYCQRSGNECDIDIDINKFALLWGEAQSCLPKGNL